MNKWNLTTDFQGHCSNRLASLFRQNGFTVVELMISLVLLAIGAALAIPSYRQMVEKRQLTHGAEQIMAFVNTAKSEAVRRNQIVTVSYKRIDTDNWCVGMVVGTSACDCMESNTAASDYCAIDSAPRIINNAYVGNTKLVKEMTGADGNKFSFDPVRGIFTNLGKSLKVQMRSDSQDYRLDLKVSNTGEAILCSHDATYAVPGYGVCPHT